MDTTDTPTLIPVREAARLAGVSREHMYRLVHLGIVEAVRIGDGGGPIRVDRDRFLSWLYGAPPLGAAERGDAA